MSKPTPTTISHGVISVIGRQRSMEDAVAVAPDLIHVMTKRPDPAAAAAGNQQQQQQQAEKAAMMDYDFFAVYDGHGDHGVAHRCKERLHHVVAEEVNVAGVDEWKSVLTTSFTKMSDEIAFKEQELYGVTNPLELSVGSMALVVLVSKEEIVVANCGRSRAVLFRDGVAVPLSRDQQSERPEENEKFGFGRDNFVRLVPTSTSIGTCSLRDQMISVPEVTVHKRTSSDEFLVIATDGLWDVVSNDMACDIIRKRCSGELVNKMVLADDMINNNASACAAMLVELALAHGSKDNISVIVVELQHFDGMI